MQLLVAMVVLRYDLHLRDEELKSVEGFMHKPVDLWAKVVAVRKEDMGRNGQNMKTVYNVKSVA